MGWGDCAQSRKMKTGWKSSVALGFMWVGDGKWPKMTMSTFRKKLARGGGPAVFF